MSYMYEDFRNLNTYMKFSMKLRTYVVFFLLGQENIYSVKYLCFMYKCNLHIYRKSILKSIFMRDFPYCLR